MDSQTTRTRHGAALSLLVVLGLLASTQPARAGGDRIFADGFDPCCQIGGTLTGLSGSGLVLHLDAGAVHEDKAIASNGLYQFAASVPTGTSYSLSFSSQPSGQTCSFSITGGTMGSSDIGNADVVCGGNLRWDQGNWGEPWN